MSNVRGKISIDVQFADSTSSAGVQSLKTVTLQEATEYTSGKVAVITGTAGTAMLNLGTFGATPYKNASGEVVSFDGVQRVAFSWSGAQRVLSENSDGVFTLRSANGRVAITEASAFLVSLGISPGVGTGTYTIVLWGSA